MLCLDLECACVTHAVQDLSYVVAWISNDAIAGGSTVAASAFPELRMLSGRQKAEAKRTFLSSYLAATAAAGLLRDDVALDELVSTCTRMQSTGSFVMSTYFLTRFLVIITAVGLRAWLASAGFLTACPV